MITNNQDLTSLAAKVIGQELVSKLNKDRNMSHQGWKILARWAVDQPEELTALLEDGLPILYDRLITQQDLEKDVLQNNLELHLSDMDKLQLAEVKMGL